MNAVVRPSNVVPSVMTPAPNTYRAAAPRVPTELTRALDHCLNASRYDQWPVYPTCGGAGLRVEAERPEIRGEGEYVRLDDGVWLLSGAWRANVPLAAWMRLHGSMCFTVMLRGGIQSAAARTPTQRFTLASGCGAVAAHPPEMVAYSQPFVGVTTEAVTLLFRDAQSLRCFGLELERVRAYLAAPAAGIGTQRTVAICAPGRAALEAAQAIRQAPYDGAVRHLYLRGKACEMLSHLLASRVVARTADESQALACSSEAGIAAAAHAALADTECQPTACEIAHRLSVTPRRVLRAFKTTYGSSLHEYAAAVRMERSRRLLLETRLPLIEVALACGYEHHSSFSTAYLRNFGESPVQTRRSALRPG
jgi:AraC-like DNA-binding protein